MVIVRNYAAAVTIIHMLIRLNHRKNLIIILSTITLVAVFVLLLLMKSRDSPHNNQRKYYYDHLGSLGKQVNSIKEIVEHESQEITERKKFPSSDGINDYENALSQAQEVCRQLSDYKNESPLPDNLADQISGINSLCSDLAGVLAYAHRLSIVTKGFVLYRINTDQNTVGDINPDVVRDLNSLIDTTIPELQLLKSDPINDPAVPELIAYLETVQKAVNTSPNNAALFTALKAQQTNLVNARSYFWINTVQIASLQKAIDRLTNNFKH